MVSAVHFPTLDFGTLSGWKDAYFSPDVCWCGYRVLSVTGFFQTELGDLQVFFTGGQFVTVRVLVLFHRPFDTNSTEDDNGEVVRLCFGFGHVR